MNIGLAIDKKNGVESKIIGTQTVPDIRGDAFGTMNEKQGGSYKNITRDIKQAQNEWQGWGTALKPSFEPIIVARKRFKGSLVDNVLEYGVGGINIEDCRIETNDNLSGGGYNIKGTSKKTKNSSTSCYTPVMKKEFRQPIGRFPANIILTYDQITFDEVCGGFPDTKSQKTKNDNRQNKGNSMFIDGVHNEYNSYNDSGSASRYFYCAKASKKDRDEGLDEFEGETLRKNIHPTVKPTELMQYLIRLVTPEGGTVLDPFMGSGSTGKACMYENKERNKNYNFIGIEKNKEYCEIARARISYAEK